MLDWKIPRKHIAYFKYSSAGICLNSIPDNGNFYRTLIFPGDVIEVIKIAIGFALQGESLLRGKAFIILPGKDADGIIEKRLRKKPIPFSFNAESAINKNVFDFDKRINLSGFF